MVTVESSRHTPKIEPAIKTERSYATDTLTAQLEVMKSRTMLLEVYWPLSCFFNEFIHFHVHCISVLLKKRDVHDNDFSIQTHTNCRELDYIYELQNNDHLKIADDI